MGSVTRTHLLTLVFVVFLFGFMVTFSVYDTTPTAVIEESSRFQNYLQTSVNLFFNTEKDNITRAEVRDLLFRTILFLSHITETDIIKLLKETLTNTAEDLKPMLAHLQEKNAQINSENFSESITSPPILAVGADVTIKSTGTWNGFPLPVIGINPGGRLGNIMGEYATIFALRKIFNVSSVLTLKMESGFDDYFPKLSLPEITIENWDDWSSLNRGKDFNYIALELAAAGLLGPRRFLQSGYPFEVQIFNAYRDEILQEFTFAEKYVKKAEDILWRLTNTTTARTPNNTSPITFIGVHIRMGDYPSYIKDNNSERDSESVLRIGDYFLDAYRVCDRQRVQLRCSHDSTLLPSSILLSRLT